MSSSKKFEAFYVATIILTIVVVGLLAAILVGVIFLHDYNATALVYFDTNSSAIITTVYGGFTIVFRLQNVPWTAEFSDTASAEYVQLSSDIEEIVSLVLANQLGGQPSDFQVAVVKIAEAQSAKRRKRQTPNNTTVTEVTVEIGFLRPFSLNSTAFTEFALLFMNNATAQNKEITNLQIFGEDGFRLADDDSCINNPCQNNATCIDQFAQYSCSCMEGFSGLNCTEDIDECAEQGICGDHTTCLNMFGSYACNCNLGYTGIHGSCTDINECTGINSCSDQANCSNMIGSYACICKVGFSGNGHFCTDINECQSNPCSNGGTCLDLTDHWACLCMPGYTGQSCSTDINECSQLNMCGDHANCFNIQGSYTCHCNIGYTRSHKNNCTDINECAGANGCDDHATCSNTVGSYACNCNLGFTGNGLICNDINECQSGPCSNDGICLDLEDHWECACMPGYTGQQCSIDIDECLQGSICGDNSMCINSIGSYSCECNVGYTMTGNSCTDIDECIEISSCSEYATCSNAIGSYSCTCNTGYTGDGKTCTDVDDCDSLSCFNGGTCHDGINSFMCACPSAYTGGRCEEPIIPPGCNVDGVIFEDNATIPISEDGYDGIQIGTFWKCFKQDIPGSPRAVYSPFAIGCVAVGDIITMSQVNINGSWFICVYDVFNNYRLQRVNGPIKCYDDIGGNHSLNEYWIHEQVYHGCVLDPNTMRLNIVHRDCYIGEMLIHIFPGETLRVEDKYWTCTYQSGNKLKALESGDVGCFNSAGQLYRADQQYLELCTHQNQTVDPDVDNINVAVSYICVQTERTDDKGNVIVRFETKVKACLATDGSMVIPDVQVELIPLDSSSYYICMEQNNDYSLVQLHVISYFHTSFDSAGSCLGEYEAGDEWIDDDLNLIRNTNLDQAGYITCSGDVWGYRCLAFDCKYNTKSIVSYSLLPTPFQLKSGWEM